MNKKFVALVVVAIVLVAAVVAVAANTKSGSGGSDEIDLVSSGNYLKIFGNANGDHLIDETDVNIIQDYINGDVKDSDLIRVTEEDNGNVYYLADANLDGTVDEKDISYLRGIIDRTGEEMSLIDTFGHLVTVPMTSNRIICDYFATAELLMLVGVQDKIVGASNALMVLSDYYLQGADLDNVVNFYSRTAPDSEAVAEANPDIWVVSEDYAPTYGNNVNCPVVGLDSLVFDFEDIYSSSPIMSALLAGYIFNNVDKAIEYVNWYLEKWDMLYSVKRHPSKTIFRTALEEAGYYQDGAMANEICLQIRDEIEEALDEGFLERQATMPSTYMSPWRKGYLGDLFGALGKAIAYTTTYDEMETLVYLYSEPDENGGIPLFERITGDKAVWYESDLVEMAGWYVSYDGMEGVTLQAELADGTLLGTAEFTESSDVAAYLEQQGIAAPGSENCRFSLKLSVVDKPQAVYLRAYRDGELLDEYELSEDAAQVEREGSRLNLDWYWDVPERHGLLVEINYKGEILNGIRDIYHLTGPILAALGLLGWLLLCAERVRSLIRREKNETGLASWLAVTALLASYLVLLGGISYSEISGWNAILYWYLSGGYPVMTAFEVLAILFAWKEVRRMLRG